MALNCGHSTIKYLLFIFNLLCSGRPTEEGGSGELVGDLAPPSARSLWNDRHPPEEEGLADCRKLKYEYDSLAGSIGKALNGRYDNTLS
ncbi:hypothetical protein AND_008751 [Anopheles darlingi]|uniref:Secreted protein n=1 Tax=Anopheles darlingi TaxID=43151 RepID=W5J9U0_ANODA|nr:hypothetical protein AND_008751 [Anopheles darlingi]